MYLEKCSADIDTCYNCRCGFCVEKCPLYQEYKLESVAPRGKAFMAKAILEGQLNHSLALADRIYKCATCSLCKTVCPPQVDIPAIIESLRSDLVEQGFVPKNLKDVLVSIQRNRNPWKESANKRLKWTENLNLNTVTGSNQMSTLYFNGCTSSYDYRNQTVSRSVVEILNMSGVDYGILGKEEICCGHPVLRIGERGLFDEIAKENVEKFKRNGVAKIVTKCPHCYHTLKNEYPLGGNLEVQHYTQLFAELADQGKLAFSTRLNKRVIYHDPCFSGRYNEIYGDPRKVLEAIPGLSLLEFPRNRENSFCCGGGGGRIWMEEASNTRPSIKRIEEAMNLHPDIIATACPFCLLNFEDAVKVMGVEDKIKVKDISEIIREAL